MKRTDYAAIADRYDENAVRHRIPEDSHLASVVAERAGVVRALDVACGTGNYLAVQRRAFGDRVRWSAVDASPEMLEKAHAKADIAGVELAVARAESLPFDAGAFDYVVSSYAFHHFEDKPRALDEMVRVLAPGGALRIANVDVEQMANAWIFRFFPEARLEDEKRYWSSELLHHELEQRGLAVTTRVEITLSRVKLASILVDAERRDASELAILREADFQRGLARIRDAIARDAAASTLDEIALVDLRARHFV